MAPLRIQTQRHVANTQRFVHLHSQMVAHKPFGFMDEAEDPFSDDSSGRSGSAYMQLS